MHGWVGQRRRGRELGANCGVSTVHQISLIQLSVVSLKRGIFSFKRENSAVVQLESASGVLVRRTAHCAVWTLESECSKLYYIL